MTETQQKHEPQPSRRFPNIVTGGSHKMIALLNSFGGEL